MTRFDIVFTGRVQGVGFRQTTAGVARAYQVSGWVRNEPDGTVRCVAEGEAEELERFVAAVQEAMRGYVRETRVGRASATGEFRDFAVRF